MFSPQPHGPEGDPQAFGPESDRLPPEITATPQHLANLIFLSYRFSQGGIGTQNRMLLYIEEHFHPDLFRGKESQEVKTLTREMVGPYFLNQKLHPATAIPWEDDSPEAAVKTEQLVTNELAGLFERFEDREQLSTFDSDPASIAQSVITMDADYLSRPEGRAGDSEKLKIKVSPYPRDPYDSIFIKHSILGVSTRTQEFDAIFHEMGREEVLCRMDQHTIKQLQALVDIYVNKHPNAENNERLKRLRELCAEFQDGE